MIDPIKVVIGDLNSPEVQTLIAEHLAGMQSNSPPGHVHALAIQGLQQPEVTFWSAWTSGLLCGCGALKELSTTSAEVKSMRTKAAFLRQGVGQAVLSEIIRTANSRSYQEIYLETGTGDAFAAAHALYLRNGFNWCEAFGDYEANAFSVFMVKRL